MCSECEIMFRNFLGIYLMLYACTRARARFANYFIICISELKDYIE